MEQYSGSLFLSGDINTYSNKIQKIQDKTKYKISSFYIDMNVYGLTGTDSTEFFVKVGNIQTGSYVFWRKRTQATATLAGVDEEYQRNGIAGITPMTVQGATVYGTRYINYRIEAVLKEALLPTITNLNIDSAVPRKDIVVSWNSTKQERYEITAVTGGNTVYTKTGNTETSHTILANTFADGQKVDITVKALYSDNGNLSSSAWASEKTSITLKQPAVKISQFKPTGTINPLADINVSWECETQATYKLELISDNKVIKTYTGTTLKIVTIPANTIYNGLVDFKLTVSDGYTEAVHTESYNVTNNPKVQILGLEPNGSVRNTSFPIEIAWSSINQKKWMLQILENNVQKGQFTGTNENSLTLPENYLGVGNIRLILYVYNIVYGEEVQDKREAVFETISKPQPPTFEEKSNYNNSKPIFVWNPDGKQKAYQILIYKADVKIEDSDIVENNISTYKTTTNLENNTTYIIKVRTKNEHELWSDYASKEIFVSFTTLAPAKFTINANQTNHSVLINFHSEIDTDFKENQIWRADGKGKFKLVAKGLGSNGTFIDYYIPGNIELRYKILSKSKNDAVTESDIKSISVDINGFLLCDAEDISQKTNLKFNYATGFEIVRNRTFVKYLGSKKMIVEDDGSTEYMKGSFTFEMQLADFDLLYLYIMLKKLFFTEITGARLYFVVYQILSKNTFLGYQHG